MQCFSLDCCYRVCTLGGMSDVTSLETHFPTISENRDCFHFPQIHPNGSEHVCAQAASSPADLSASAFCSSLLKQRPRLNAVPQSTPNTNQKVQLQEFYQSLPDSILIIFIITSSQSNLGARFCQHIPLAGKDSEVQRH